jgi:hypothetical protein
MASCRFHQNRRIDLAVSRLAHYDAIVCRCRKNSVRATVSELIFAAAR